MATNVTEKDKTLKEVIDWCEQREIEGLRPDNPVPIAIMNSHVRLAVSFDEHETGTTGQNKETNMKETNR